MSPYLIIAVWFILAVYLFVMALRQYRFLFILSGYMLFLAVWELLGVVTELNLKVGIYPWIYRGAGVVVLILCALWYFLQRRDK